MKKLVRKERMKQVLLAFDQVMYPSLSKDIADFDLYANKLIKQAVTYVIEIGKEEVGFITFYIDDEQQEASFITLIAVLPDYQGQGLAQKLLEKCIQVSRKKGKKKVRLEVNQMNERAISFYEKNDFQMLEESSDNAVYMERLLS